MYNTLGDKMQFRSLTIADKEIFEAYKSKSPKNNCDFCFSDLFLWKAYYNTEISINDDILYLRCKINNQYLYFIPLNNTKMGIENLINYTKDDELIIINIEEQDLKYFDDSFAIKHIIDNDDYVYLASDLATLGGKKYKAKRNFVNSFKEKYNYKVIPINEYNETEDIAFLNNWIKNNDEDLRSFNGEEEAIILALHNLKKLNLDGLILKVDEKVVAISIGTYQDDTFITHFEKADYNFHGASQMINYLMANYVCSKVKYINREEDLGIEGLRKAKLSYHPIKMIKSFTAFYNKNKNI